MGSFELFTLIATCFIAAVFIATSVAHSIRVSHGDTNDERWLNAVYYSGICLALSLLCCLGVVVFHLIQVLQLMSP